MSDSSQQQNSLDNLLTDTITITGSNDYSYIYDSSSMSTITLSPSISTYSIGTASPTISTVSIDTTQFSWNLPEEWVNSFPDWQRVEDMCKKYPGLEIALRNFRTVYTLVKDDYDNPKVNK